MFDIGFWELMLVGVVALLVLGPERLPAAARTAGLWVSRARRALGSLRAEIEREVDLGELQRLEREANAGLRDLVDETRVGVQTKDPTPQAAAEPRTKEPAVTSEDELSIDGKSKRSAQ
ncbi:MAG: Sec-independent protein translocase protein TatB [Gammaproteobacteria bacterium]